MRADRPEMPHFADIASGIYGTILVTAVLAVTAADEEVSALSGALIVAVTALVFWLAHTYANLLALRLKQHARPSWAQARHLAGEEWPLVEAGIVPAAVLLIGAAGLYSRNAAFAVAMWLGVVALFVWGLVYARMEEASLPGMLLAAFANAALGMVIILLEAVIH